MKASLIRLRWPIGILTFGVVVESGLSAWYRWKTAHQSVWSRYNPFAAKPIDAFEPWLVLGASVTILAFFAWTISRFRAIVPAWNAGQLMLACGVGTALSWAGWLAWSNGENATSPAEAIWTGVFVGIISGGVISAFAIAWIWFGARGGRRASSER